MASSTVPDSLSLPGNGIPDAPPLRQLWQVPVFFLGLVALGSVWWGRPLWQKPSGADDSVLVALSQALTERNLDKAQLLTEQVLQLAEQYPDLAGEAYLLAGSVHVALAETSGQQVTSHWSQARKYLEQAETLDLRDEMDRPRLLYRLAKTWAHTGEPLQRVIDNLSRSVDEGAEDAVDRARGYGLLAAAYLRLPQPDLEKALAANEKQLGESVDRDDLLAPARLLRGELLLRQNKDKEAREVLKRIGPKAPPELVTQARSILVRSLESDSEWAEAALVWREILDDRQSPPRDRHVVLYRLGVCHQRSEQYAEAARAWEECMRLTVAGDEVVAAALGLANIRLHAKKPADALPAFQRIVREVSKPGDWRNSLASLERVRNSFEAAYRLACEEAACDLAVNLAGLYERVCPVGRAAELRGLALEAGAKVKRDQARKAASADANRLQTEADSLLVQAGQAFEQSAGELPPGSFEQGEQTWRSALAFCEGRDQKRAVAALERFLKIGQAMEGGPGGKFHGRLGEAWYRLAETYRTLDREDAALAAFKECLRFPGRYAFRARFQLAKSFKVHGEIDQAEFTLKQNLKMLRDARQDQDAEAQEKTCFALGELYFEKSHKLKEELSKAIACLEMALDQFPNSPEALTGRFELAESYRLRAEQLGENLKPQEPLSVESRLRVEQEIAQDREKAYQNYQEISKVLFSRPVRSKNEDLLLEYASLTSAECRFWQGDYTSALDHYEALVQRFKGRPGYLKALAGMVRCYYLRGSSTYDLDKAKKTLEEIRRELPKADLDADRRQEFENWLKSYEQPGTP
jgi:tetratricopeptide (TPR) repeat protein